MNFEEYLVSKKIDEVLFQEKENALWVTWKQEFATMHPNSFTAQKLYLINPLRRKYPLKIGTKSQPEVTTTTPATTVAVVAKPVKPAMVKPAMPKPTISKPVISSPTTSTEKSDLTQSTQQEASQNIESAPAAKPVVPKPAMPRPVIKPKPKTE